MYSGLHARVSVNGVEDVCGTGMIGNFSQVIPRNDAKSNSVLLTNK